MSQINLFSPIKEKKQTDVIDSLLLETPEKSKLQAFNSPIKSNNLSPWQNNNSVKLTSDRLISIRKVLFHPGMEVLNQDSQNEQTNSNCEEYTTMLEENLLKLTLDTTSMQDNCMQIENSAQQNQKSRKYNERILNLSQITLFSPGVSPQPNKNKLQKSEPKILNSPTKILSAPGLLTDFYSTPLSSTKDSIYILLNNNVYRINNKRNNPDCLVQSINDCNCIASEENQFTTGSNQGEIELFSIGKQQNIGACFAHSNRITALTYASQYIFAGSTKLTINDIRCFNKSIQISSFPGHNSQQICKLTHNKFNENQLFVGTNDNQIYLIDIRNSQYELSQFSHHTAAVRAILPISSHLFVSGQFYIVLILLKWRKWRYKHFIMKYLCTRKAKAFLFNWVISNKFNISK